MLLILMLPGCLCRLWDVEEVDGCMQEVGKGASIRVLRFDDAAKTMVFLRIEERSVFAAKISPIATASLPVSTRLGFGWGKGIGHDLFWIVLKCLAIALIRSHGSLCGEKSGGERFWAKIGRAVGQKKEGHSQVS